MWIVRLRICEIQFLKFETHFPLIEINHADTTTTNTNSHVRIFAYHSFVDDLISFEFFFHHFSPQTNNIALSIEHPKIGDAMWIRDFFAWIRWQLCVQTKILTVQMHCWNFQLGKNFPYTHARTHTHILFPFSTMTNAPNENIGKSEKTGWHDNN